MIIKQYMVVQSCEYGDPGDRYTYHEIPNRWLNKTNDIALSQGWIENRSHIFVPMEDKPDPVVIVINPYCTPLGGQAVFLMNWKGTDDQLYKLLNDALNPA